MSVSIAGCTTGASLCDSDQSKGADEVYRPTLPKGGFLTRDPRMKERKKYGLKRARKAPRYTKR